MCYLSRNNLIKANALLLIFFFSAVCVFASKRDVKKMGARGDGINDDSKAIEDAINSTDTIVFSAGTYKIARLLKFTGLHDKVILAKKNAVIINVNDSSGSFLFDNCKNIEIQGGKWTRTPIYKQGKGEEHTFYFRNVHGLIVNGIYLTISPQMGIAMGEVVGATISNNRIENCFRDGIYSHYSAKLTYINNTLSNIKDDAMSMHDYGIDAQKKNLINSGYTQAGFAIIKNNIVRNCYQGFASIGCNNLMISNNKISNTVNAGIAVFNSENLFKGGKARVANVVIANNVLLNTGGKQNIIGKDYPNYGQLTTGRSAIFVATTDSSNFINNPHTRLSNIRIENNSVTSSYVNGAYLAQIDSLVFMNNTFLNCDIDGSKYSGRIVEVRNCSGAYIYENSVQDTREKKQHMSGYEIKNVSGKMGRWTVKGYIDSASRYIMGDRPVEIQ